MAERRSHPPSPEAWAGTMFVMLGVCAAGVAAVYFLGALTGRQFLWVLLLIGFAALSVTLRYLGSPGRRG